MAASDSTRKMWPVEFELEYEVKLSANQLETALIVHNTHTEQIDFHALLHNYIYVGDVRDGNTQVAGLSGLEYFDKVAQANKTHDAELRITAETDSIYYNAPSTLTVSTKGVNAADRTVVIEKSGFIGNGAAETKQDTDAVIWNPWVERSKTFKDFGAEEYINMLAVEPGRVSQKQALPAGQTEKNLVMSPPYILQLYLVLLSVLIAAVGSEIYSAETTSLVPDDVDSGPFAKLHAKHARMLVHANVWGIMATTSVTFGGSAFANVVSYSDGVGLAKEDATGTLFFYLSVDDFTAMDLKANPNATVALSKAQGGAKACLMDAEDPTCWRLSLTGRVVPVKESQRNYAERVVFSKHPQMKHWPTHHDFRFYVLEIEHIVFLDFYGPAQHIPVSDYYKIKL
ncbi:hypothetical protein PI124_g8813 [Phytophthora idaei]|nr:hypothetical protein PI125_g8604 [Phytophthora idaei]KAG3246454.1 hypothetical protein PI124_g8813 [Phytophthora idaei]